MTDRIRILLCCDEETRSDLIPSPPPLDVLLRAVSPRQIARTGRSVPSVPTSISCAGVPVRWCVCACAPWVPELDPSEPVTPTPCSANRGPGTLIGLYEILRAYHACSRSHPPDWVPQLQVPDVNQLCWGGYRQRDQPLIDAAIGPPPALIFSAHQPPHGRRPVRNSSTVHTPPGR